MRLSICERNYASPFNGYVDEAIGADGDMVLKFPGPNSVI